MKLTFSVLLLVAICFLISGAFFRPQFDVREVSAQSTAERGPVRMVRFVLLDDGLYPARMQVDQGLLNLAVEDKTGKSKGLLVESVQDDQSVRVTQITRAQDGLRGRALLKLPPGRYRVSDASQPSHTAELIVNP